MDMVPNMKKVEQILTEAGVILGYLFGSRATGNARADSDYDIAIYLPNKLSASERFDTRLKLSEQLTSALGATADVTILNDTRSVLLRYSIISEGKIIINTDDDVRVTLESRILSDYFDFEPFLTEYGKAYV